MAVEKKSGVLPTGTTIFYTMIGTPIVQVKSPFIYNSYFAEHGIDAVMIAMDVPSDQVKDHFELMRAISNFGGCIVTIPHKQAAVDSMDTLSPRAKDLQYGAEMVYGQFGLMGRHMGLKTPDLEDLSML